MNGGTYAAIFNTGDKECRIEIPMKELELNGTFTCTELWSGLKAPVAQKIGVRVAPHGAKAFSLVKN